jgi:hypothetical protein
MLKLPVSPKTRCDKAEGAVFHPILFPSDQNSDQFFVCLIRIVISYPVDFTTPMRINHYLRPRFITQIRISSEP